MRSVPCDILIVGASTGGVAAALAAAEAGAGVCVLEATEWPGGQLTAQGVCVPDEQRYIETFGGTRLYYRFRDAVRDHYRQNFHLSDRAATDPFLNPGSCWVSKLSYEPKVGVAVLREMLRPWVETGRLQIHYGTSATACEMDPHNPNRIANLVARHRNGKAIRFEPRMVLDATDLGDVLALCGEEGKDWITGAESRAETGEPDAPEVARPDWVQPFTFPFALEWSPATVATNVIEPPADYAALKEREQYGWKQGAITGIFTGSMPWWTYRRILAAENFQDPRVPADVAMINVPSNDFYGGNVIGSHAGAAEDVKRTLAEARRASLGYVYWLQTECPREELGSEPTSNDTPVQAARGYPEFRLRRDLFDTEDGCAISPYIRESRRIRACRTILEKEIVVKDFSGHAWQNGSRAAYMPDTVGIGHYALDIHPNCHGEPNAYVATRPFQIPLGALVPIRLENLLAACKNIGTTHLTNGAYRLHPIEWNIGESAGHLAAYCVQKGQFPRAIVQSTSITRELQCALIERGIPLHWFVDVPLSHPHFIAIQTVATLGAPLATEADLLFHPDDPIQPEDWRQWRNAISSALPDDLPATRAEAVRLLFSSLQ